MKAVDLEKKTRMGNPKFNGNINLNCYDEKSVFGVIKKALRDFGRRLNKTGKEYKKCINNWIYAHTNKGQIEQYFTSPKAFPMVQLPFWFSESKSLKLPENFFVGLTLSTICGYFYIRLTDNIMDDRTIEEIARLPMGNFFHTEFLLLYQNYFSQGHSFWDSFRKYWYRSAEKTIVDAAAEDIDFSFFSGISANKTVAVKIPLTGTAFFTGTRSVLEPWLDFVDRYGLFHQMYNDVFSWQKDMKMGIPSYFLSEGKRRRREEESLTGWVVREGFGWGAEMMDSWLSDLQKKAGELESPSLIKYLELRQNLLAAQKDELAEGLKELAKLLGVLRLRRKNEIFLS